MKILFLLLCAPLFTTVSCGVKTLPVAPERKQVQQQNLDCSPTDPECDKTDPHYSAPQ